MCRLIISLLLLINVGCLASAQEYKVKSIEIMQEDIGARVNWSGSWRLPSKSEFDELINKCNWSFITMDGHGGYKVTGPNGNYIFLPAAGFRSKSSLDGTGSYGDYWSSTPHGNKYSYLLDFSSSARNVYNSERHYGQSVRPVLE